MCLLLSLCSVSFCVLILDGIQSSQICLKILQVAKDFFEILQTDVVRAYRAPQTPCTAYLNESTEDTILRL